MSFSPWCSQETVQSQIVHLNLNGRDDRWIQGHVLPHAGLYLVGYFAAPSSFHVFGGGSTSSTSLELSLSDIASFLQFTDF